MRLGVSTRFPTSKPLLVAFLALVLVVMPLQARALSDAFTGVEVPIENDDATQTRNLAAKDYEDYDYQTDYDDMRTTSDDVAVNKDEDYGDAENQQVHVASAAEDYDYDYERDEEAKAAESTDEHVEKADHASKSGTAETTTSELMSKDDEESSTLQQKKKEQADATSGQGDKAGQDYAEAEDVDKKKENKGTQKVGNAEEDITAGSDSEDEETAAAAKTAGKQESGNEDKKTAEQQKSVDAEEDETHTAVESDSDYDNDEGQASEDEEMPQEDDTHKKKASTPAKTAVDQGEDGKVSEEAEEFDNEPDYDYDYEEPVTHKEDEGIDKVKQMSEAGEIDTESADDKVPEDADGKISAEQAAEDEKLRAADSDEDEDKFAEEEEASESSTEEASLNAGEEFESESEAFVEENDDFELTKTSYTAYDGAAMAASAAQEENTEGFAVASFNTIVLVAVALTLVVGAIYYVKSSRRGRNFNSSVYMPVENAQASRDWRANKW